MLTKEIFSPNDGQQKGINHIAGPIMLLAGPGTGKTYTLVKRVEKMLEKGIEPESILCLTFSDAASTEMKSRLISSIGAKGGGVYVSTYHSFCMDIIRGNPSRFEMAQGVQTADDITKQAILKESIDEYLTSNKIEFLKDKWGNKYFYISSILAGIETIKRERTTKEEFFNYLEHNEGWVPYLNSLYIEKKEREKKGKLTKTCLAQIENQEKKIGKASEFYSIFEIYQKKMSENNLIDYSDMINLVLDKVEGDENFLEEVTKDFKYVLVDEYQDTSKVQNEIIFNILKGAKTENIFVVGDDDQIIYSFQGARSRNLNDFLEKFKNAEIIPLKENRRSTQTILDFAQILIDEDPFRLTKTAGIEKKLIAKNEEIISKDRKIKFNIFQDTIQEDNKTVDEIESLIKSGVKPSEISILSRKNDALENFSRLFKQKGIPCLLSRQKSAYDVPSFIQAYFYLKILVNSYLENEKLFGLFTSEVFKVKDSTVAKFLFISRKTGKCWFEILKDNVDTEFSDDIGIQNFYKTYVNLRKEKSYTPLLQLIYKALSESGILNYYANQKDCFENVSALKRLIDEAKSFSKLHKGAVLEDFVSHLDTYLKENIKIELEKPADKKEAVQLLTYHGSKGREFDYVFMPNLTSRAFEKSGGGNRELLLPVEKSLFSEDKELNKNAELRRLLFVGITRAKFGLILSYSNSCEGTSQSVSKYISNLFPKAEGLVESEIFDIDESSRAIEIIKNINFKYDKDTLKEEIESRVQNLVLSQSSLNCYLECPLKYFYREILKVPVFVEDKDILTYGSSIHYAIDFLTKDAIKNKVWGNVEILKDKFEEKIRDSEFTSPDKKNEFLERGRKSIEKNYSKLVESNPEYILSTECRLETQFEGTTLKGFIDRISTTPAGEIQITDFKTGSYKKVCPNESYYNQLRFYKFLYETVNPDKKVSNTSLVFFEEGCKTSSSDPDTTNNQEIKDIIKNAIESIKKLNFEPKMSDNGCKFCPWKLVCKLHSNGGF